MPRYQIVLGLPEEVNSGLLAAAAQRILLNGDIHATNVKVGDLEARDTDRDTPGIQVGGWQVEFTVDADASVAQVGAAVVAAMQSSAGWVWTHPSILVAQLIVVGMELANELQDPEAFTQPAVDYMEKKARDAAEVIEPYAEGAGVGFLLALGLYAWAKS